MTEAVNDSGISDLGRLFNEILQLQPRWSSANTPEMQRRGLLVRDEAPRLVRTYLRAAFAEPPFDIGVEGRDGTGLKTRVPWIRVFSKSRSPRATDGWYVVYLFAFDGSCVYLSLNQGTTVPGQFTMRPADELAARVKWARKALDATRLDLTGLAPRIALADEGLGRGYERGNVLAIRYEAGANLSDVSLGQDLKRMVELLTALYAATGEPTYSTPTYEALVEPRSRPPLADLPAFIEWVRQTYGPTLVSSRQAAERQARELLNELSGRMSTEQAIKLGELFNTGEWGGIVRHNRFAPAFVGATMQRVTEPLDVFNDWTERLWRSPEDEALQYVDQILKDTQAFPGAGRSYPTMLMYLRDPVRFPIWLQITHRGLTAIHRLSEAKNRSGGVERYLRYCQAARTFADEFHLSPQEIDAVLSEIARASADETQTAAEELASLATDVRDESEEESERLEYPLTQVAAMTHLPLEQLEEWVELLQGKKRQALFFGPPGTGKTFVAEELGRHLAGASGEVELVQFHPSFSYEDFLEGLRPESTQDGAVSYVTRPGVFKLFCGHARNQVATHVFIIDEINRAELGAVLGELMVLLEYRGRRLTLPYSQEKFFVPDNVVVLATMNTADRSLALADFALRRRFHAFEMRPNRSVLDSFLTDRDEPGELALAFFDLVQRTVDNPDFAPGHSYWMTEDVTAQGLYRVWRYELLPYLAEYWFEHRSHLQDLDARVTKLLSEEA